MAAMASAMIAPASCSSSSLEAHGRAAGPRGFFCSSRAATTLHCASLASSKSALRGAVIRSAALPLRSRRTPPQSVPALPHLTIRCARVGGVEVPNAKRIEVSLQYIHGVGKTTARQILLDVELENKMTKELSEEELTKLRDEVSKYMIEGDLRRFNALAIKRLRDIQCYRGRRHIMGLPCRGQHTKCNARTRKGKKVTIAGKKKSPGK